MHLTKPTEKGEGGGASWFLINWHKNILTECYLPNSVDLLKYFWFKIHFAFKQQSSVPGYSWHFFLKQKCSTKFLQKTGKKSIIYTSN